jgi:hypothetical protein
MSSAAQQLTNELKAFPGRFVLKPTEGKSDFWGSFCLIIRTEGTSSDSDISGYVVCKRCKSALTYNPKGTGSSHLRRHHYSCDKGVLAKGQQTLVSTVARKVTLSEQEKFDMKRAELGFVVLGHQSFNSLENEGLTSLMQLMVTLGSKHGRFNVSDVFFGLKTISTFCKQKYIEAKDAIRK